MLLTVLRGARAARAEAKQLRAWLVAWVGQGGERPFAAPEDALTTLGSPARVQAVVLDALVSDATRGDAAERLATELLAGRDGAGSFGSNEADAWAILALSRGYAASERKRADVTARAWVDETLRVDERLRTRGATTDAVVVAVAAGAEARVTLTRRGTGPLYYALTETAVQSLTAEDHGFVVARRLVAADDPRDVQQADDGSWRVRLGARVRVVLTVVAPAGRRQVEVRDPGVPGFVIEPSSVVADGVGAAQARDERLVAWTLGDDVAVHIASLSDGPHVFSYVARASLRGRMNVAAPAAQELVDPSVRGRATPDVVRVE